MTGMLYKGKLFISERGGRSFFQGSLSFSTGGETHILYMIFIESEKSWLKKPFTLSEGGNIP